MGRPARAMVLRFALNRHDHYVPRRMRPSALILLLFAATMPACGNEIGDECDNYTDCIDAESDRLCLSGIEGFPGGYCTIFNCRPDECPQEAACVAYRYSLAPTPECSDDGYRSRLQRSYCMLRCNDDSDCRPDYKCLAADGNNPLGAVALEQESGVKICSVPYSQPSQLPERQSEVCEPQLGSTAPGTDGGRLPFGEGGAIEGGPMGDASSTLPDASELDDGAVQSAVDGSPLGRDGSPSDGSVYNEAGASTDSASTDSPSGVSDGSMSSMDTSLDAMSAEGGGADGSL